MSRKAFRITSPVNLIFCSIITSLSSRLRFVTVMFCEHVMKGTKLSILRSRSFQNTCWKDDKSGVSKWRYTLWPEGLRLKYTTLSTCANNVTDCLKAITQHLCSATYPIFETDCKNSTQKHGQILEYEQENVKKGNKF